MSKRLFGRYRSIREGRQSAYTVAYRRRRARPVRTAHPVSKPRPRPVRVSSRPSEVVRQVVKSPSWAYGRDARRQMNLYAQVLGLDGRR